MTGQRPPSTQHHTPPRTRRTRRGATPRNTVLRNATLGITTALLTGALQLTTGILTAPPATADPTTTAWNQLRDCESGGDYTITSANHHYGAYQFDQATWHSVGGTGRPDQATPTEQDYRALYLYRMRGWQPWTCAHTLGLPPDADAASKRRPTYNDAAYINRQPTTPAWPGKVYTYGDCDTALRTWQHRMNTYGYHFTGTGCYYTKTRTAVLALQRANHLTPSGQLGPRTWRAAWHGNAPQH
jgi:hypothetical protein